MPTVRKMPAATREELDAINTAINALIADVAALKLAVANTLQSVSSDTAVVADLTALKSAIDTMATKLNNDATVTDTNYAGAAALTAAAPSSTNILSQGGTAGRIKLSRDAQFAIGGAIKVKPATDDLWNLSALATLSGTAYRATALYLDASGTATIASSSSTSTTAQGAIDLLEATPSTKARIGIFVANPSTNYANALDAQGTYYAGQPASPTAIATAITLIAP